MWRGLGFVVVVALAGCTTGGNGVRTDDINDTEMLLWVQAYCDGNASIWDWLVVFEAETTDDVFDMDAEVIQDGRVWGPIDMWETRPGEWYGEAWEDDLGMDCEGSSWGVTFYAVDGDGRQETLDL